MKKILTLMLSIFLLQCASTKISELQNIYKTDDYIFWDENRKLAWEDFKGEPLDTSENYGSEIIIKNPSTIERANLFSSFKLTSICVFDKRHSWVNKKVATPYLLLYNQTIFDIYELYVRKLRKEFSETDFGIDDYSEKFHSIAEKINSELIDTVEEFRKESKIGKDENVITQWSIKIKNELEELKQFEKES